MNYDYIEVALFICVIVITILLIVSNRKEQKSHVVQML